MLGEQLNASKVMGVDKHSKEEDRRRGRVFPRPERSRIRNCSRSCLRRRTPIGVDDVDDNATARLREEIGTPIRHGLWGDGLRRSGSGERALMPRLALSRQPQDASARASLERIRQRHAAPMVTQAHRACDDMLETAREAAVTYRC